MFPHSPSKLPVFCIRPVGIEKGYGFSPYPFSIPYSLYMSFQAEPQRRPNDNASVDDLSPVQADRPGVIDDRSTAASAAGRPQPPPAIACEQSISHFLFCIGRRHASSVKETVEIYLRFYNTEKEYLILWTGSGVCVILRVRLRLD